jgi:sigma-B regulation protein RsbU (phosphoserine phosphatase)
MSSPTSQPPAAPPIDPTDTLTDPLEFAAALSRSFAQTQDIDATVREALSQIVKLLRVEAGAIFLLDELKANLICRASVGPVDVTGLSVPNGSGIVGRAVTEDRIQVVEHAYEDQRFFAEADRKTGFVTRSILCAPMGVAHTVIGAVEVLNKQNGKPFNAEDQNLLRVMAASAALAISNARMADRLVAQERLQREVELAAEIQRHLLPTEDNDASPICGLVRPIQEVSGDFYDHFELPDGTIAFAIGDVSGKGLNASLLMSQTASLFRCLGKTVRDPARLMSILNREICATVSRGMFVTMVSGLYDPATGHLRFANAGHIPPLLRRPNQRSVEMPADSPPLGILPGSKYETEEVNLEGAQFILCTDGVTEFRFGDEELGTQGLDLLLDTARGQPLLQRLNAVVDELQRAGWRSRDDLTLLAIDDSMAARSVEQRAESERATPDSSDFLFGLSFPADPKRLKLVRPAIRAAAEACGFDENETDDVLLAAGEAIENIIVHAYGNRRGEIALAVHRMPDGLMLRIRDFAPNVDPAKIQPRKLEDVRPGGLGTHFIRAVMDDASFIPLPDGEGNLLELVKRKR